MKEYFDYILLLVVALTTSSATLQSNDVSDWTEYERTIDEKFSFSTTSPTIEIENKYGEVNLISADRSDAIVEVTITVESRNESRANDMFGKIDVEFDNTQTSLKAKTSIDGWGWTKKNEKYRIDYTVYLPIDSKLSVSNKYGDISLTDHNGPVEIDIKYGNGNLQNIAGSFIGKLGYADGFRVGHVHGSVELDASYSKFSMLDAESIICNSKYSNLSFENTGTFTCDSKYDKVYISSADVIRLDGKYDEVNVGAVGDIDYEMDYTSLKIDEVLESGRFDTKYGSVSIYDISDKSREIRIEASHTDYKLSTPQAFDLKIDTKYTSVHYPDDLNISFRERDSNELSLEGTVGNNPRLKITAHMKYGGLRIRER